MIKKITDVFPCILIFMLLDLVFFALFQQCGCSDYDKMPEFIKVHNDLDSLEVSCNRFKHDVGYYPDKLFELFENKENFLGWQGPYIENKEQLIDSWGNPYLIFFMNRRPYCFYLFSYYGMPYYDINKYHGNWRPLGQNYFKKPDLVRKYLTNPPKYPPVNIYEGNIEKNN